MTEEELQQAQEEAFRITPGERFDRMKDMLSLYTSAYAAMTQRYPTFSATRNRILDMLEERIEILLKQMNPEQI